MSRRNSGYFVSHPVNAILCTSTYGMVVDFDKIRGIGGDERRRNKRLSQDTRCNALMMR